MVSPKVEVYRRLDARAGEIGGVAVGTKELFIMSKFGYLYCLAVVRTVVEMKLDIPGPLAALLL